MALYEEAWKSFRKDIVANKELGWNRLSVETILSFMDLHLEEARQRAEEYRKKIGRELERS